MTLTPIGQPPELEKELGRGLQDGPVTGSRESEAVRSTPVIGFRRGPGRCRHECRNHGCGISETRRPVVRRRTPNLTRPLP